MMMKAVALLALLGVVSAQHHFNIGGDFMISKISCDRNNGDKHDEPFNMVVEVSGANPGRRVAIYPAMDTNQWDFDLHFAVCAEWNNNLQIYSPLTEAHDSLLRTMFTGQADENGVVKMRFPMGSYCYEAEEFVAVQSLDPTDANINGHCQRTEYAHWGDFVGFHFSLELPRFDGTPDSTRFYDVLTEFAFHNLLSNDEDGVFDHDDSMVTTSPEKIYASEWVREDADESDFVLKSDAVGSVFAYFAFPAFDYDHAMFQLRHVRRLFEADGDKRGMARRTNTNGSQILEKELQKRMNAAGLDASMANIKLSDSGILTSYGIEIVEIHSF